jgi:hypothetical protein
MHKNEIVNSARVGQDKTKVICGKEAEDEQEISQESQPSKSQYIATIERNQQRIPSR